MGCVPNLSLLGSIGNIGLERLISIKKKLSAWIMGT